MRVSCHTTNYLDFNQDNGVRGYGFITLSTYLSSQVGVRWISKTRKKCEADLAMLLSDGRVKTVPSMRGSTAYVWAE